MISAIPKYTPENPPAYAMLDDGSAIVFQWEWHLGRTVYDIYHERRQNRRVYLGQIERDEKQQGWFITEIERNKIPKLESNVYLDPVEASWFLYEQKQEQKLAQRKAELAA